MTGAPSLKKRRDTGIESDGVELYFVFEGRRIAKRGRPNTPEAKTWVTLVPGFQVVDDMVDGARAQIILKNGAVLH